MPDSNRDDFEPAIGLSLNCDTKPLFGSEFGGTLRGASAARLVAQCHKPLAKVMGRLRDIPRYGRFPASASASPTV